MNRIYQVIWSKTKHMYVVVSEIAHHDGKTKASVHTRGTFSKRNLLARTVLAALTAVAVMGPVAPAWATVSLSEVNSTGDQADWAANIHHVTVTGADGEDIEIGRTNEWGGGDITVGSDTAGSVKIDYVGNWTGSNLNANGKNVLIGNTSISDSTATFGGKNTDTVVVTNYATTNSKLNFNGKSITFTTFGNNWNNDLDINAKSDITLSGYLAVSKDLQDTNHPDQGTASIKTEAGNITVVGDVQSTSGNKNYYKQPQPGDGGSATLEAKNGTIAVHNASATEFSDLTLDGKNVIIDGSSVAVNGSKMTINGENATIKGGSNGVINVKGGTYGDSQELSEYNINSTGTIIIGEKDMSAKAINNTSAVFHIGTNSSDVTMYGGINMQSDTDSYRVDKTPIPSTINGKKITIQGGSGYYGDITYMSNDGLIIGSTEAGSEVTLDSAGILNSGGPLTIDGKSIHITPSNPDGMAVDTVQNGITHIGSDGTEEVVINGKVDQGGWGGSSRIGNGVPSQTTIQGKNITVNRPNNYDALNSGNDSTLYVGNGNSENVTIHGTVVSSGGNTKVNGQHITLDQGMTNFSSRGISTGTTMAIIGNAGSISVGSQDSKTVNIDGMVLANAAKISVDGEDITINDTSKSSTVTAVGTNEYSSVSIGSDITKKASITGGLSASSSDITVLGKNITVDQGNAAQAAETGIANISIGSEDSDTVNINGRINLNGQYDKLLSETITGYYKDRKISEYEMGPTTAMVKGKNITLTAKEGDPAIQTNAGSAYIGTENSEKVTVNGQLLAYGQYFAGTKTVTYRQLYGEGTPWYTDKIKTNYTGPVPTEIQVQGKDISVTSTGGTYAALSNGGKIDIGTEATDKASLTGGIQAEYEGTTVLGKTITVDKGDSDYALFTNTRSHSEDGNITVGSNATTHAVLNGGIQNAHQTVTVTANGNNSSITGDIHNGDDINHDFFHSGKTIVAFNGNNNSITGNVTNLFGGTVDITDTGNHNSFTGNIENRYAAKLTMNQNGTGNTITGESLIDNQGGEMTLSQDGNGNTTSFADITVQNGSTTTISQKGSNNTLAGDISTIYGAKVDINQDGNGNTIHSNITNQVDSIVTISNSGNGNSFIGTIENKGREHGSLDYNSVTLLEDGVGNTLTGDIVNEYGQTIVSMKGSQNAINGNISNKTASGKVDVTLTGAGSAFTGTSNDTDLSGITLHITDGAAWNERGMSTAKALNAANGTVNTKNGKLGDSIVVGSFDGSGTTWKMDIDATNNKPDDLLTAGSHKGTTAIDLTTVGAVTDGAKGKVLAISGKENGVYTGSTEVEGKLFWDKWELARRAYESGDEATFAEVLKEAGLTAQDVEAYWYLKNAGHYDPKSRPTTSVQGVYGAASLVYNTWRTDNDKLLKRMGELRQGGVGETGLWARTNGNKIERNGKFGFRNKYETYELGYDAVVKNTATVKRFVGGSFRYLDGNSSFARGNGENNAYGGAFYVTDERTTGHYLDLIVRYDKFDTDYDVWDTYGQKIHGDVDADGYSLSAEYGRKNKLNKGWYIEPQTQLTLGYLKLKDYTTSNGIAVCNSHVRSAVWRGGFNLGKEFGTGKNKKGIVYAKANLYHEFGGSLALNMASGNDHVRLDDGMNDTWFEYGLGASLQLAPKAQLYFDIEKSTGSDYKKDWAWNAGLRFEF